MFKKNEDHLQKRLFSFESQLSEKKKKKLRGTSEYHFYEMIFCNIDEEDFSLLYSETKSRPNAPINSLVSALILMNRRDWSYEELFKHIDFDLLTMTALGISELDERPFCEATIFNFQNRLTDHYVETNENLLEKVFDKLTEKQLRKLKIKTDIQRSDSFFAASNIRRYSRLQLLVEVLIRLYRILLDEDNERYKEEFSSYVKNTSGQYIYRLKGADIKGKLVEIGKVYHLLYSGLRERYVGEEIFKIFERVYFEHFSISDEKVEVKSSDDLCSGSLQSPDDIDATYRKKGKVESWGQSINVTETANPENCIQLVNDICVNPNNKDDSEVLNKRIDKIKEKTPDLNEFHTDGGYGSEGNDIKMEDLNILHVQTAIRGPAAKVEMDIEKKSDSSYSIRCPYQEVESLPTKKRHKACMSKAICQDCSLLEECPVIEQKKHCVFYFSDEDYLRKKRNRNIDKIPPERRNIRPNVEATVKEFKRIMRNGKLKVRTKFKTELSAFTMGISVNFGRIYRYVIENPELYYSIYRFFYLIVGNSVWGLMGKMRRVYFLVRNLCSPVNSF